MDVVGRTSLVTLSSSFWVLLRLPQYVCSQSQVQMGQCASVALSFHPGSCEQLQGVDIALKSSLDGLLFATAQST